MRLRESITNLILGFVVLGAFCITPHSQAQQEGPDDPIEALAQASELLSSDPQQALDLATELQREALQDGDLLGASRAEEVRAQAYVGLRDFNHAGMSYDQAIAWAEEAQAPARSLAILSNLSKLHFRIGEYHGAMDAEQQSLEIARRSKLPLQEAQSLNNIGVLHRRQGDADAALDFYQESLAIREQIGDQRGIAQSLNNIGILHKNWGNYFQALDYHLRALAQRRVLDNEQETAESLSNIGIIYRNLSDYGKALEYFTEARQVLGDDPELRELATSELNIGHTLLLQGRFPEAERELFSGLEKSRQLSLRPKIAESLELLGVLALAQDDPATAIAREEQALRLAREIGEPAQIATILTHRATALLQLDQPDQALASINEAIAVASKLSEPSVMRDAFDVQSKVLAALGRYQEALQARQAYEESALDLLSATNSRRMADLQASLEIQRSAAELQALQLQNDLQNEVVQRQRLIGVGLIFSVAATLAVIVLLVSRFRLVRRVNATLSEQSARIQRQHEDLTQAHGELERRAEELAIAATTDPLTGLYNRYFVIRELDRLIKRAISNGRFLSIVIMDYDHFKQLNDSYTHMGGDRVLRDGATLMREHFGPGAIIGRFGGEEFLTLLPEVDLHEAQRRSEQLRQGIEQHRFRLRGRSIPVTISFGVAEFSSGPQLDLDGFLHLADEALYQAKREGRNRVVAAGPLGADGETLPKQGGQ